MGDGVNQILFSARRSSVTGYRRREFDRVTGYRRREFAVEVVKF